MPNTGTSPDQWIRFWIFLCPDFCLVPDSSTGLEKFQTLDEILTCIGDGHLWHRISISKIFLWMVYTLKTGLVVHNKEDIKSFRGRKICTWDLSLCNWKKHYSIWSIKRARFDLRPFSGRHQGLVPKNDIIFKNIRILH